jgi:hypothetical protein
MLYDAAKNYKVKYVFGTCVERIEENGRGAAGSGLDV